MKRFLSTLAGTLALALLFAAPPASAELPDFRDIVRKNSPAVVKILGSQKARSGMGGPQEIDPRYYEQLPEIFRHFFDQRGQQAPRERQSMGSGFLISEDGYILTNHHVIDGADTVLVRLIDRREFEAKVVGADKRSDLALLKIDASGLPVVSFGSPGELEVGEWVVAIGSPFGLDYSVTAGIVSARGRSLPTEAGDNYVPFIQTDVAINPGNSGGPLFNLQGEVVGINSQIYTRSGGSMGLSFAIPIEVAQNVVEQLKESGKVVRGWLGVGIQEVDRDLAESFGLDRPMGALISQMEPGGPAESAGIEIGDVIVKVDGQEIGESADLPHVIGLVKPGSSVRVELVRNGKSRQVTVKVGTLGSDQTASLTQGGGAGAGGGRMGLQAEDIPDAQRQRMRLQGGVLVREVTPGKAAARAGLRAGDVVTQIGNVGVGSVEELEAIVADLPANTHIPVRILRRGPAGFQAGFVAIRIEE